MVILVDVDDDMGFWVRFFKVEVDESESESESELEPELEPVLADETLEATEDTLKRSTWIRQLKMNSTITKYFDLLFSKSASSGGS